MLHHCLLWKMVSKAPVNNWRDFRRIRKRSRCRYDEPGNRKIERFVDLSLRAGAKIVYALANFVNRMSSW